MAKRLALMEKNPITVPSQKFLRKANFAGKPYSPHLRCSIRLMISAARTVKTKSNPSLSAATLGVSDVDIDA